MTTKQSQTLAKDLLPDLPGFVAEKRMVFKSPVDDFLRALFFENTSDADFFHLWVFFLPLFPARDSVSFNFGKRIGSAQNWRLDNPNLPADLRGAIHDEALPFLQRVSTTAGVIDHLRADVEVDAKRVNPHTLEALAYTFIRSGDYPAALNALQEINTRFSESTTAWVLELVTRAKSVEEKLSQNPETALTQLEIWKDETKAKLALTKYS